MAGQAAGGPAGAAGSHGSRPGAAPVLSLRALHLQDASGRALVCGVDLLILPGESVGLVGESGSGKTLTARAALGLLPAGITGGAAEASLAGTDVYRASPREHRRLLGASIGYVPQNTLAYLQPAMRIRSQLVDGYRTWHPGVPRAAALERAAGLLEAVGIGDVSRVLASYPGELSGGMRQRVNIAMALMGDPALVVADEPTAALDSLTAAQVADLLFRLTAERGVALLVISHDLGLVRERCNRVHVMYAGRCVEDGPCDEVLDDPRHPYTRALLAAVPPAGAARPHRLADIPGAMPAAARDADACAFAPRCPHALPACRAAAPTLAGCGGSAGEGGHRVACLRAWDDARPADDCAPCPRTDLLQEGGAQ